PAWGDAVVAACRTCGAPGCGPAWVTAAGSSMAGLVSRRGLAPLAREELLEQGAALGGTHAGRDRDAVIEPRLVDHVQHRTARARLGVRRTIDQTGEAREHDRARAHRARLERHVERAVAEPPGMERVRGRADRQDLGMG